MFIRVRAFAILQLIVLATALPVLRLTNAVRVFALTVFAAILLVLVPLAKDAIVIP